MSPQIARIVLQLGLIIFEEIGNSLKGIITLFKPIFVEEFHP